MSSELALSIGLFSGYLAAVLYLLWPTGHTCHDRTCTRQIIQKGDKK